MEERKNEYLITSCRYHSDEINNGFYSNKIYSVGDTVVLDGLKWTITRVIKINTTKENKELKRVWTKEEIKALIQTNDKVLYGALKQLYARQTADERKLKETNCQNGLGFNGVDAPFLTNVAEFLLKTGFLTDKQKVITRRKLVKYTGQLTRIANGLC